MKLDPTQVLKYLDDNDMKDKYKVGEEVKERTLTVGLAVSGALVHGTSDPKDMTPTKASDMYTLAVKMREDKPITLTNDQVDLICEVIIKAYQPLISGQIISIIKPSKKK